MNVHGIMPLMESDLTTWRHHPFWTIPVTVVAMLCVPVLPLVMLLSAPFLGLRRSFKVISPYWIRTAFRLCRVDYQVSGWEALPASIRTQGQPVVFMSNHESSLDPTILIDAIPIPVVYLMKKELKWRHPIGWASMLAGFIFIDRSNPQRAHQSMAQAAQDVRAGKNLLMFPEGTRTRTGRLLPFKKGGFNLALEAGVPIVPLVTVGGFSMLPAGSLRFTPGRCRVAFGAPVYHDAYPDRDALMAEVRSRMEALWLSAQPDAPGYGLSVDGA